MNVVVLKLLLLGFGVVLALVVLVLLVVPTSYWLGGITTPCGSAMFPTTGGADKNCNSAYNGQWLIAAFVAAASVASIVISRSIKIRQPERLNTWAQSSQSRIARSIAVEQAPAGAQSWLQTPGRMSGFVCGLVGLVLVALPLAAVPLGIVGWVQSAKAVKLIPEGTNGRGLAIAGLTLSIIAVSLSTLFAITAIPAAIQRNF